MKKWIDYGQILATVFSVAGVVLNNYQCRWCFPLWLVSNAICFGYHWRARLIGLAVRDGIFIALAVAGWIQWS